MILIIDVRKLRLREIEYIFKSYISSNWQGWNLNLCCDLNPVFLPFILFHLSSKDLYEDLSETKFHWNVGNLFYY